MVFRTGLQITDINIDEKTAHILKKDFILGVLQNISVDYNCDTIWNTDNELILHIQ